MSVLQHHSFPGISSLWMWVWLWVLDCILHSHRKSLSYRSWKSSWVDVFYPYTDSELMFFLPRWVIATAPIGLDEIYLVIVFPASENLEKRVLAKTSFRCFFDLDRSSASPGTSVSNKKTEQSVNPRFNHLPPLFSLQKLDCKSNSDRTFYLSRKEGQLGRKNVDTRQFIRLFIDKLPLFQETSWSSTSDN